MMTGYTANGSVDRLSTGGAAVHPPEPPPASLAEALERLDIETARRVEAVEKLRESEERFRTLSERAGRFLWISDPQTNELIYTSPGYEEVWARKREDSYWTPEQWANSFKRSGPRTTVLAETAQAEQTYQVTAPDGSLRWIRDRMFPVRDAAGQVQRILGIAEDITEAKLMHEGLVQATTRAKALLAVLPDLLFRLRRDGTILEAHAGKDNSLSLEEASLVGRNVKQVLPASLAAQATQHLLQAIKTRQPQMFTCQYLLPNELRDFEARAVVCADDEVLVIVRDVTERKRMEREIVEASHREQQRIGEDLHDGLGQHLTGITFLTRALERKLATKAPEEAKEAGEIGRLVLQALAQTRNLARGLFPAELERNGLVAALSELAETVQRTSGVRCTLRAADRVAINDNVLATHVFRIAQEAINNSIKHSRAKNIDVTIEVEDDRLKLAVTDDGTGFSPAEQLDGLGLRIMQFRARRIGGDFQIAPGDRGGTSVTCSFRNKYESN
jgi:PAS domain S-box-containing protein